MTVGTRRILVKEVTSLFELKPGVIEEADLVASGMTLPQQQQHPVSKGTVENEIEAPPFKYPKEELNAPVGLVIHMLGLIVRYLGIKLPFLIFHKETRPYIRMIPPNTPQLWDNYNKMPLFLEEDDKNFKRFVIGMAMLNYNLAYLCYTQNVKIPLSQVANTLQSLMACCRAPNLGL
ncbi:UV radiation resistance protein/autophagy-related protein 14 [Mycotypha africana]|uniref:UV radiation resistance protein/autophagy-related protein 14 n=1 Tax=Mycotypha africana TaxID=64632 RepID=UPI0023014C46|nr:UV radiation resistance protein/autophagy-related protein 14 [Mycotypha africana]KAI8987459.1 UV radiation resistance protein/autophagy-related protein 14 [Mycotypha africana]